jgi:uridylate kinase
MYKRILLKLSGESFLGNKNFGIDLKELHHIAKQVVAITKLGIQVAIVIGAGNIWRYRDSKDSHIERATSDAMGMLGTVMNSVAFQSAIESYDTVCRVCSSINVPQIAEPYLRRKAIRHLEKGRVVICAGGTGSPYFTTDSAAALRGLELNCDILLKATRVDGVYSDDPEKNPQAKRFDKLTFHEVLEKDLYVMDQAAISLCKEGPLPIMVFDMTQEGNILKAAKGEMIGTVVSSG